MLRPRRTKLPTFLARAEQRYVFITTIALFVVLMTVALRQLTPFSQPARLHLLDVIAGTAWYAFMLAIALNIRSRSVARRRAKKAELHACTTCLADLRSSPASGNCPECGTAYTKRSLERTWRACFGFGNRKPGERARFEPQIAPIKIYPGNGAPPIDREPIA